MPVDVEKIDLRQNHKPIVERFTVEEGKTRRLLTEPEPNAEEFYNVLVIRAQSRFARIAGQVFRLIDADLPEDKRLRIPEEKYAIELEDARELQIMAGDPEPTVEYIYESQKPAYELRMTAPRHLPRK